MNNLIIERSIEHKIFLIRGHKVIIDRDMAELYGVTVKALNQAVKRNKERFPIDFTFQLTLKEKNEVVTNCDHLHVIRFSHVFPYVFTEHGALMASTILNSPKAIQMSVYVIRAFVRMRKAFIENQILHKRLAEIDTVLLSHDTCLRDLYGAPRVNTRGTLQPAFALRASARSVLRRRFKATSRFWRGSPLAARCSRRRFSHSSTAL